MVDALSPYGIRHLDMPIKPENVWRIIGKVKPGASTASLVSTVDIAPTLLELAGVAAPAGIQGKSFIVSQRIKSVNVIITP